MREARNRSDAPWSDAPLQREVKQEVGFVSRRGKRAAVRHELRCRKPNRCAQWLPQIVAPSACLA